jgi:hypothetical protein
LTEAFAARGLRHFKPGADRVRRSLIAACDLMACSAKET